MALRNPNPFQKRVLNLALVLRDLEQGLSLRKIAKKHNTTRLTLVTQIKEAKLDSRVREIREFVKREKAQRLRKERKEKRAPKRPLGSVNHFIEGLYSSGMEIGQISKITNYSVTEVQKVLERRKRYKSKKAF